MAPVIRDLGSLEGDLKKYGDCRGYVGTQGFMGSGKESFRAGSLIGVEAFESSFGF